MTLANGHANGVVTNGHAPSMVPFAIPPELHLPPGGPVASWPQPDGAAATVRTGWWSRRVTPALRAVFAHRGWLAAIPVILVNSVAFGGQLAFLRTHLPWPLPGQVLVAVTLESVAVYLAWQAHLALAADDSALRLRLAAYGFAAVIGVMNYTHWMAPGWRPTFAAVTFGLMSLSSPWLWSVHSRRVSRDALKARGLIEAHAVRLGATRWTWHPIRSWRVMFRATWQGVNDPATAIALAPVNALVIAPDDDSDSDTGDDSDAPPPPPDDDKDDDDTGPLPDDDKKDDAPPPPPPLPPDPPKDRKPSTGRDRALAIMKRHPGLTDAEVAKRANVSVRTVQRARS